MKHNIKHSFIDNWVVKNTRYFKGLVSLYVPRPTLPVVTESIITACLRLPVFALEAGSEVYELCSQV